MMLQQNKKIALQTLLLVASFQINPVFAAIPNILGTYSGTDNGSATGCSTPVNNGPYTDPLIVDITNQSGSSFSGTIDDSGSGADGTISGTIDSTGNVSGTTSFPGGESESFSGSIKNGILNTNYSSTTVDADGCSFSGTYSATGGNTATIANAQVQQSKQIVRVTNTLISQHLANELTHAFFQIPDNHLNEPKQGASSDGKSIVDSFWGTTSIAEIHEDGSNLTNFDTDIYQFVGGVDKRFGKLFLGSALTYAYSETEQKNQDSNSHVIGVTPYAAYQLTDFMFVSGLAGYNYSLVTAEQSGDDFEVHDYIFEGNLNLYKVWDKRFIGKARFGSRFHHSIITSVGSFDDSTDELVWLGDLELGYRFGNGLITYIGGLYEYTDRESSYAASKVHDGIAYMRGGFDYPITNTLTLGSKVQADLNDEDRDIITGSLTIRMDL